MYLVVSLAPSSTTRQLSALFKRRANYITQNIIAF